MGAGWKRVARGPTDLTEDQGEEGGERSEDLDESPARLGLSRARAGHDAYLLVGVSSGAWSDPAPFTYTYEKESEKMTRSCDPALHNRPGGTRPSRISRI